jgi:hypothetical protein
MIYDFKGFNMKIAACGMKLDVDYQKSSRLKQRKSLLFVNVENFAFHLTLCQQIESMDTS